MNLISDAAIVAAAGVLCLFTARYLSTYIFGGLKSKDVILSAFDISAESKKKRRIYLSWPWLDNKGIGLKRPWHIDNIGAGSRKGARHASVRRLRNPGGKAVSPASAIISNASGATHYSSGKAFPQLDNDRNEIIASYNKVSASDWLDDLHIPANVFTITGGGGPAAPSIL